MMDIVIGTMGTVAVMLVAVFVAAGVMVAAIPPLAVPNPHPRLEKIAWAIGWTVRWGAAAALVGVVILFARPVPVFASYAATADLPWSLRALTALIATIFTALAFGAYQGARWVSGWRIPTLLAIAVGVFFGLLALGAGLWAFAQTMLGFILSALMDLFGRKRKAEDRAERLFDAGENTTAWAGDALQRGWRIASGLGEGPISETVNFLLPDMRDV